MSDLQCPARFLVLTDPGPGGAPALRHERVAAVYDGRPGPAATELAEALGVPAAELAHRVTFEAVLAQDGPTVDALGDLADLHRGETVVVLAEGGPGRRAEVEIDGDGVRVSDG